MKILMSVLKVVFLFVLLVGLESRVLAQERRVAVWSMFDEEFVRDRMGADGAKFFKDQMGFAAVVVKELGWKLVGPHDDADLVLSFWPNGEKQVPSVRSKSSLTCQHLPTSLECVDAEGNRFGATDVGGSVTVWDTPARDTPQSKVPSSVDIITAGKRSTGLGPRFNVSISKPKKAWQWAWRLCEQSQGFRADCKGRMKSLWNDFSGKNNL